MEAKTTGAKTIVHKKRKMELVEDDEKAAPSEGKIELMSDDEGDSGSSSESDSVSEPETETPEEFKYGTKACYSQVVVTAKCTAKVSTKCKGSGTTSYSNIKKVCDKHDGNYVCGYCARTSIVKKQKQERLKTANVEPFVLGKYGSGSNVQVRVFCEFKMAPDCTKEYVGPYYSVFASCESNDGKYMCMRCAYEKIKLDRSNRRYEFDDNLLEDVDTEFKAYFLGWIGSDGHLGKNGRIIISVHKKDSLILEKLRDGICKKLPISKRQKNMVCLDIYSRIMNSHACKWFGLSFTEDGSHKKSGIVKFPDLKSDKLKWHFLRGYFDGDGTVWFCQK